MISALQTLLAASAFRGKSLFYVVLLGIFVKGDPQKCVHNRFVEDTGRSR